MPHSREQSDRSQYRAGDGNDDFKENAVVAATVDFSRFLQAFRQSREKGANDDHVINADDAGDHQNPERVEHAERTDKHIGWNQPAAKEHGYDKEHHVVLPEQQRFFGHPIGQESREKDRQHRAAQGSKDGDPKGIQ
ncbi:hypothetical protein D1872_245630 [compost metagenome]